MNLGEPTLRQSVFIVKMTDHDGNHRCLVDKNVPIVLILPGRWQRARVH